MADSLMRFASLVVLAVLLICPNGTEARPWRPTNIPNGWVFNCQNCHEDPKGGGKGSSFGNQIYLSRGTFLDPPDYSGIVVWGPLLASLDADNDGFTNGEELGDPDGLWVPNGPPPQVLNPSMISNPGDRFSTPPQRPVSSTPPGNSGGPAPDPPPAEPIPIELEGIVVEGESTVPDSRFIEVAEVWLFEVQITETTAFRGLLGEAISGGDIDLEDEVRVAGVQLSSSVVRADTLQLAELVPIVTEEHSADFDESGWVDMADFLLFADVFGSRIGQAGWDFKYDLVLDGKVDFKDFLDLVGKFNRPG